MTRKFDLVVIGTGAAASTAAYDCAEQGQKVAIIDSRPFGGTCVLRGCEPKKVLVSAAECLDMARRLQGKGPDFGAISMDWPSLMRFKRSFTGPVPENREKGFRDAGIETVHGWARFAGRQAVQVGDDRLEADKILIAAGAVPQPLHIDGEEHIVTSDEFLDLDQLPGHICFAGGGYIGFEFAHVAVRAGAQVTILHRDDRPLGGFDPDLAGLLVQHSREIGIDVRLNAKVERIVPRGGRFTVHTSGDLGEVEADLVVHSAGRVPQLAGLDLEAAGVAVDKRGVTVNDQMQSVSNPAVYAAGDVASTGLPPLTPVASYEGKVAAWNLCGRKPHRVVDQNVPSVVFTIPPLASAGLGEKQARELGLHFQTKFNDASGWYSSRRIGARVAAAKILIEEDSERILGAHLLGPGVEETINLFALAMRAGAGAPGLKETLFAYPTHASDIGYLL